MTNWTEVNVYTGRPVDEDAPTNFAGTGSGVDMNPTGMKKKKKRLEDARTKSYKTHRAKLETARVKREAKRNGVKEEVELDEFKKVRFEFKDKKDMMKAVKDLEKQGHKVEKGKMSLTVTAKRGHDLNRQAIDIVNFYGAKANAMYESVERKTFSQKVKESVSNFNVESLLAEDNVDVLRSIVKNKAMKPIKLKDGAMKVDLFTASAIVQVLDKIKPANKIKLTKMLNGKKSDFMRASEGIMKMIGKR